MDSYQLMRFTGVKEVLVNTLTRWTCPPDKQPLFHEDIFICFQAVLIRTQLLAKGKPNRHVGKYLGQRVTIQIFFLTIKYLWKFSSFEVPLHEVQIGTSISSTRA